MSSTNFNIQEYYDKGRYDLAIRLCILLGALFFLLTVSETFNSIRNTLIYAICALLPISLFFYLKKSKNYRVVYLLFCFTGSIIDFFTINFFNEEYHFGDFLWMILIIQFAFFGLSYKWAIFFILINLFTTFCFIHFSLETNTLSLREKTTVAEISLMLEIFVAIICISSVAYYFVKFYRFSYETLLNTSSNLKKNNEIISAKNKENTLLLKEIHHRVKNNLQIVISLLRLQKNNVSPEVDKKFEEAISRIMTMALIHRKLYQSEDLSKVNIESYINDLINELSICYVINTEIKTTINSMYNDIGLNTIVPLGLMINELLTNSFKHAFNDNQKGEIYISIEPTTNNYFILKYNDNGIWKISDENNNNFGMELIETLTEQLEGTIVRNKSSFVFNLKNLDT